MSYLCPLAFVWYEVIEMMYFTACGSSLTASHPDPQ